MGSKGGGSSYYAAPPDNTLELERMRQEEARINREREDAKAAAELEQRRATFGSTIENATQSAQNRAIRTLQQRGLDPNQYNDLISAAIADQRRLVPDLDPRPGDYFNDDFINNILQQEQAGQRSKYVREIDQFFRPGFENEAVVDTADDPWIADVLEKQRQAALQQVQQAKTRGNLDDTGYQGALTRLDDLFKAGSAQAQSLGGSVLQGYRENIRDVANRARSAAGSYELGGMFNPQSFYDEQENVQRNIHGNIEGDIRSALNGTNFFDIGDIITQGGITQGAVNPRLERPEIIEQRQKVQDATRGLGGQGTF